MASAQLSALVKVVTSCFGAESLSFSVEAEQREADSEPFSVEKAVNTLANSDGLGFFLKDVFGAVLDNTEFRRKDLIFPHSRVMIQTVSNNLTQLPDALNWLRFAQSLTEGLNLETALVLGDDEHTRGYYRTPLGAGIGLIKIYWIMCFGKGYSDLIAHTKQKTKFFIREEFGGLSFQSFVSAPTFESYRSAKHELIALQRAEIGDELFNRLPVDSGRATSHCYWVGNPIVIFRFIAFLVREFRFSRQNYQAVRVPDLYRVTGK